MANADRPQGFKPYEKPLREGIYVAGGTMYPGDCVKLNSSGQVVVAAAGDRLLGVAAAYAVSGDSCKVWDHPDQKYVAQCDDGTSVAQGDMGNNADILATAGSSAYRQSRQEIDISTKADTAAQIKLLAILPAIDNAAGEFAKVVCQIQEHELDPIDDTGV
jgi:hypothetical protein